MSICRDVSGLKTCSDSGRAEAATEQDSFSSTRSLTQLLALSSRSYKFVTIFLLTEGRGVKILLLSYSHLPPGLGTNQELQSKLQAKRCWQLGRFCNWHSKISVESPHWDSFSPLQILPPDGKQSRRARQRSQAWLQTNVHRCCINLFCSSVHYFPFLFFMLYPYTVRWCIATSPHTY